MLQTDNGGGFLGRPHIASQDREGERERERKNEGAIFRGR